MEIERIQQLRGLKVERTGSESERRRHQRPEEDFSELLEHSMMENRDEDQPDQSHDEPTANHHSEPPANQAPVLEHDTVILSTTAPLHPLVAPDRVSISASARVSAESLNASHGALSMSLVQQTVESLRKMSMPAKPLAIAPPEAKFPPIQDPPDPPASVDTVA